jgi:hypothetical protein
VALIIVVVALAGLLILLSPARAGRIARLALVLLIWTALVAFFGALSVMLISRIVIIPIAIVVSLRHTPSLY